MALTANVGLSGEDCHKSSFALSAKATNLNKHGAAIQVNRELLVGSTLLVRNARGTKISARVVARLNAQEGTALTYGVEFAEEGSNFWGITFPSSS